MTKNELSLLLIKEKARSKLFKGIALQMIDNNDKLRDTLTKTLEENRNLRFNKLMHEGNKSNQSYPERT